MFYDYTGPNATELYLNVIWTQSEVCIFGNGLILFYVLFLGFYVLARFQFHMLILNLLASDDHFEPFRHSGNLRSGRIIPLQMPNNNSDIKGCSIDPANLAVPYSNLPATA